MMSAVSSPMKVRHSVFMHMPARAVYMSNAHQSQTEQGFRQYRNIASGIASLVIKYHGTISGEHSEGLARGEFSEQLLVQN